MKNPRAARRYATALMAVAEERNVIDRVASDLELLAGTLRESRDLRRLLASPVVPPGKKVSIFRALFATQTGHETLTFLDLLFAKRRAELLPEIANAYAVLRDEKYGIVTVDVTTAVELAPPQEQRLHGELERYTGKKVRVRFSLDRSIRGGLLVRIGDRVLDATVEHQLALLRAKFLEGGPLLN